MLKYHFQMRRVINNNSNFNQFCYRERFLTEIIFLSVLNGYGGGNARRRVSPEKQGPKDKQEAMVVYQKPGPLQMIFDQPADEVNHLSTVVPSDTKSTCNLF